MESSTWSWYSPGDVAGYARRLKLHGLDVNILKAGGDDGTTIWKQWREAAPYAEAGLRNDPFFYIHHDGRYDAIVESCQIQPVERILLNPEVEWRSDDPGNPFRTLAEAQDAARRWVGGLRNALQRRGFKPALWFSSVPSWASFPYEGFSAACDGAQPQHYWLPHRAPILATSNARTIAGQPVVPIIGATQVDDSGMDGVTWTDRLVREQIARAREFDGFDGLSAWQSGATRAGGQPRGDFAYGPMAEGYALVRALGDIAVVLEPGWWHFDQTGFDVVEPFWSHWKEKGGLEVFGLPISPMYADWHGRTVPHGHLIQWFERGVLHQDPAGGPVQGLRAGAELLKIVAVDKKPWEE